MQRGSEVWVWTGKDTAFERGKVESLKADPNPIPK